MSAGEDRGHSAVPQLDEELWRAWVEKGRRNDREYWTQLRKVVFPACLAVAFMMAVGYQYFVKR